MIKKQCFLSFYCLSLSLSFSLDMYRKCCLPDKRNHLSYIYWSRTHFSSWYLFIVQIYHESRHFAISYHVYIYIILYIICEHTYTHICICVCIMIHIHTHIHVYVHANVYRICKCICAGSHSLFENSVQLIFLLNLSNNFCIKFPWKEFFVHFLFIPFSSGVPFKFFKV